MKRILFSLLLIPYIIFGQQNTSGSTKWYRVMGDQLEINTQNELKKIARENNILFEAFTNKYGFSIEEPLMYYLSGDEIIEITWWAAKDAAKAQTTGFEQFRREMGLTFDYDKVSKQRDYILNQRRISQGKKQIESGKDKSPNYSNSSSDYGSAPNYSNNSYSNGNDAGTGTLIFLIILILVIVLIVKNSKSNNSNVEVKPLYKKNSSGSAEKTNFNKTSTERSFDKEYQELDKMMLSQESYSEVYPFIKTFREKLRVGEIYLEEMTEYIKNNFSDYDGGKIMFKISLFEQMEHIFGTYLNEWEEKKNSKFNGFEDVEQYHTLSQKVIIVLQELLQEQISNLGKKTKINNSSSDTKAKENINNPFNIADEMPPKIDEKLYKKDMSGLQAYFKEFPNMEHIFNQFTYAIRKESTVLGFLGEFGLLNDKKIRKATEKGFKDVSSFLEDMLKLQENTELRKDYEACVKALKILEKDLSSLYDFEKKVLKREKTIRKMYSDFLKSGIRTNSSMNAKELKVIENYKSTFKLALRSDLFIDRAEAIKIHLSEFWKTKNFSDLEKAEKI